MLLSLWFVINSKLWNNFSSFRKSPNYIVSKSTYWISLWIYTRLNALMPITIYRTVQLKGHINIIILSQNTNSVYKYIRMGVNKVYSLLKNFEFFIHYMYVCMCVLCTWNYLGYWHLSFGCYCHKVDSETEIDN